MKTAQGGHKPSKSAMWLVESRGVELFDAKSGKRESLPYPQAAIWDLLVRGYGVEAIGPMVELIGGIAPAQAAALVAGSLEDWIRGGWLEAEGGGG